MDRRAEMFDALREFAPMNEIPIGDIPMIDGLFDRWNPTGGATSFDRWLPEILKHEGGYVNHLRDPGGATNKGIIQRTYDAWRKSNGLTTRPVRSITDEEVSAIYRRDYWDRIRGDDLPEGVNYAVFDFAVNSGVSRASRFLQDAVGAAQDGKIGPMTLGKVARVDPKDLVNRLCAERMSFLRSLSHWNTFGKGWSRRVAEVLKLAGEAA